MVQTLHTAYTHCIYSGDIYVKSTKILSKEIEIASQQWINLLFSVNWKISVYTIWIYNVWSLVMNELPEVGGFEIHI